MTEKTRRSDTDLTVVADRRNSLAPVPPSTSRRMDIQLAREMDRIRGISEIGGSIMDEMSETERYAAYKVATTAAAADFLAKAAALRGASPAEQEAQQERFENYLRRMGQIADATNIKLLMEFDQASEDLRRRTFADTLEDFDTRVADAILGRRRLPPAGGGR